MVALKFELGCSYDDKCARPPTDCSEQVEPELVNTTGSGFHLPDDGVIEITSRDDDSFSFNISDFWTTNSAIAHVTVHCHQVDHMKQCTSLSVSDGFGPFTAECFQGFATVIVYVYLDGSNSPSESRSRLPSAGSSSSPSASPEVSRQPLLLVLRTRHLLRPVFRQRLVLGLRAPHLRKGAMLAR